MKKPIKIITITMLTVLVILTFVSRSVYNKNLPQVTAVSIKSDYVPLVYETTASLVFKKETTVYAKDHWRVGIVHVSNGDAVTPGDLLMTLNTYDLDIQVLSLELDRLRFENALALHLESVTEAETALTTAPINGVLYMVDTFKTGQQLEKGTLIGRIIDDSTYSADIPFISYYRGSIKSGMEVEVLLTKWAVTLKGVVGKISAVDYILNGIMVFNVEIIVDNPGALTVDDIVQVTISAVDDELIFAAAISNLRYTREETILAPMSGVVTSEMLTSGVRYKEGDILLRMKGKQEERDARWQRTYDELIKQIEITQKRLERLDYPPDGCIYATSEGIVGNMTLKQGDTMWDGYEILTIFSDKVPNLAFTLPAKEGEVFGMTTMLTATIGVTETNWKGERVFYPRHFKAEFLSSILINGVWECFATLEELSSTPVLNQDVPVKLIVTGIKQENVVPLSAVVVKSDGKKVVYYLQERAGLFGLESFVSEIEVIVLYDNGEFASIKSNDIYPSYMQLASDPSQLINNGDVVWVREQ